MSMVKTFFPIKLISLKEAAKISGYHSDYLSFLIREKKLFGERIGRSWCTTEDALNAYLAGENKSAQTKPKKGKKIKLLFLGIFVAILLVLILEKMKISYPTPRDKAINYSEPAQIVNTRMTTFSPDENEVSVSVQPTNTMR